MGCAVWGRGAGSDQAGSGCATAIGRGAAAALAAAPRRVAVIGEGVGGVPALSAIFRGLALFLERFFGFSI